VLWSQLPGEFDRIPSDRTPHELLASSSTGRMHGSTGVQLRICTVDPSGSRVVTRCIGVPVEHRRHNTNTQLLSSRCLARSCHTHQSPGRVSLSTSESLRWLPLRSPVSETEWLWDWVRPKTKSVTRFPLGSTEALVHNHQGGFQKLSTSKPWRTDVNKGEASSESWLLKEELEIWPNYGKRDDRMFTFKSRSRETIQFFSDR